MRDKTKPFTVALTGKAAILAAIFCSFAASAVEVKVDFSKGVRPMKPMHAVGQPLLGLRDYQLFRYLKEAGVPYARLHDIGSSVPHCRYHMVDIPNVFPDFDADENDPANYDFLYTDKMLAARFRRAKSSARPRRRRTSAPRCSVSRARRSIRR